MSEAEMQLQMQLQDGVWVGPLRRPLNPAQTGSIHDDGVAQKLGFRGGTIAGSIHMEQFPPLLLRAFGPRWYQSGKLSLYFQNATLHQEPVRCHVAAPGDGANERVRVWMEREDGLAVAEGSASVGEPEQPSALRERVANLRPAGELRILADLRAGAEMGARPARTEAEELRERLKLITEPLPEYERDGVLTPVLLVNLLRRAEASLAELRSPRAAGTVGLFGAIEFSHHGGPARAGHDYEASGRVLAVGDTPKTEYFWYESELREPGGDPVAGMVMMLRFMKASSPLWQTA
jgi:hypothetical protein